MIEGILTKPEPTEKGLSIMIKAELGDYQAAVSYFRKKVIIISADEYDNLIGHAPASMDEAADLMETPAVKALKAYLSPVALAEYEAYIMNMDHEPKADDTEKGPGALLRPFDSQPKGGSDERG